MKARWKPLPDIVDLLRRHGLERAGREGRELLYCCPFHDDTLPSLRVNPAKQVYCCPVCVAEGNPKGSGGVVALANALGVRLLDLARASGLVAQPTVNQIRPPSYAGIDASAVWGALAASDDEGERYLASRYIKAAVDRGLVRFATEKGPAGVRKLAALGYRVVAPLYDADGAVAALSLRNTRHCAKGDRFRAVGGAVKGTFYGKLEQVRSAGRVVIAEGLADTLTLALTVQPTTAVVGVQSAATFVPESIRRLLRAYEGEVLIAAHKDQAGAGLPVRIGAALNHSSVYAMVPVGRAKDWNALLASSTSGLAFGQACGQAMKAARRVLP